MNSERLLEVYEQISEAPDAIARLRRFVLDLAVRGKLVEQDVADEPAQEFLKKVRAEKARLTQAGVLRKSKALKPINAGDHAFGIPTSWSWARLGDLIDLVSGQHLQPAEYSEDPEAGIPYITGPSDFGDEKLVIRRFALVRKAVAAKGQLLLTVKGSGVGKTAPCDLDEVAISRQLMALTPILMNAGFLELVAHGLATKLQDEARSLIPGISRDDVNLFAVAVPPLAEQHRIVAKADELMGLCDRLEEARKTREEVRDQLTAASLARLTAPETTAEDFPTHAAFALEALPALTTRPNQIKILRQTILNLAVRGKLVECQSGSYEKVGTYRTLQNGYAFKSGWFAKNGIRLLRNANVGHGDVRWTDAVHLPVEMAEEYQRFSLREGDIVLTLDRPFIATGTKVARVRATDLPSLLLQRVGRFSSIKDGLSDDYLFMWINSPHFNDQIDPGRSNGVPHISTKQVEAAAIFVPPLAEQHRIVAKVDALMALCDRLEAALTTTDTTRTRLLEALLHEALVPAQMKDEAA